MKPQDYSTYFDIIDWLSSPVAFPSLGDFVKYVHAVLAYKQAQSKNTYVVDVGAGTGYFSKILHDLNPKTNWTLIEPSEFMYRPLQQRFETKQVNIINQPIEQCIDLLEQQDVFIFQRSLYALSGNFTDYHNILIKIRERLNPEGIVAAYEINQKYNLDIMKNYLIEHKDNFHKYKDFNIDNTWPILEEALMRFNNGVDNGEFTLFTQKKMNDIFSCSGFSPVYRKDNYCFFKKQ